MREAHGHANAGGFHAKIDGHFGGQLGLEIGVAHLLAAGVEDGNMLHAQAYGADHFGEKGQGIVVAVHGLCIVQHHQHLAAELAQYREGRSGQGRFG